MISAAFVELEKRLTVLERRIPTVPASQTTFTDDEQDAIAAYALLTCAACERYVEDVCKWIADEVFADYAASGVLRRAAKHLLLVKHLKSADIDKMPDAVFNYGFRITLERNHAAANAPAISSSLSAGVQSFKDGLVKLNNGVDLHNIKRMLCAIGFDFSSLEPNLRSYLPILVELRGDAAHSVVKAQQQWHPTVLQAKHAWLVDGFAKLDKHLCRFRDRMN